MDNPFTGQMYDQNPELKEVIKGLEIYTTERGFFKKPFVLEVELGNLTEELGEFFKARGKKSNYKMVDALCDISVFGINALRYIEQNGLVNGGEPNLSIEYKYGFLKPENVNPFKLFEVFGSMESPEYMDTKVIKCIVYSRQILEDMGYDYIKCMHETIKEISSRVQDPAQADEWEQNGVSGKWEKWKEQPEETLYKADYDSCIVEMENAKELSASESGDYFCEMCKDTRTVVDYNTAGNPTIPCPNCQ